MFLKIKILKKLEFDEYITIEELHKSLRYVNITSFRTACDYLGRNGFIAHDSEGRVSLCNLSSLYEYRALCRKAFFEIAVSVSTIVMALTSIATIFL